MTTNAATLTTEGLFGGLTLALIGAAAINLGFLLQHRGLQRISPAGAGALNTLRAAFRSPHWLSGQALGWAGFGAQIAAVSIAPLSLVQAFAAGGLALSVPLAAELSDYRIPPRVRVAVTLTAVALASLPIGVPHAGERLYAGALAIMTVLLVALAALGLLWRTAPALAIVAGILYGLADAGIKAVSVDWSAEGSGALISAWTVLAATMTFGGFLAFQAALRAGSGLPAISLMTAFATLVALGCGVVVFGESLGQSPGATVAHLLAIALVLACVPVLALAQSRLSEGQENVDPRTSREGTSARLSFIAARRTGEQATNREQQALEPWSATRTTGPEHLAQPEVPRERERRL